MDSNKKLSGKTSLDLLFQSFFCFGANRTIHKFKKRQFGLNKISVVKPLPHKAFIKKKLTKMKHRMWLKTNPILKWETSVREQNFRGSILLCALLCYSNASLTKLKTLSFRDRLSGGPTKLCGHYSFEDWTEKSNNISSFCVNFYGVSSTIESTLMYMVLYSGCISVPHHLPHNWKRPPFRTRKPGVIPRLDLFYSGKTGVVNLIRDICIEKPHLIACLIKVFSNKMGTLKQMDRTLLESNYKHKGVYIISDWSWSQKENLLYEIFSCVPFVYWGVYTHYIRTSFLRESLFKTIALKGDYYGKIKLDNLYWEKYTNIKSSSFSNWIIWEEEEGKPVACDYIMICKFTGKRFSGETTCLYTSIWGMIKGTSDMPIWLKENMKYKFFIYSVTREFDVFYKPKN